jgi:transketolase
MRKDFAEAILTNADDNPTWVFITGDLGYMALENVEAKLGKRFINAGVAEQNMLTVSAALAHEGFIPWVYSISPFVTLRPYEQIRNDVCLHKLPVKIVGNGGGYGYGIMGATHHNIEDIGIMRILPNMKVYVPFLEKDINDVVLQMSNDKNPNYLRLNTGAKITQSIAPFAQWRKIKSGKKGVVVGTGPVVENIINSVYADDLEIWVIGIFPIEYIPEELVSSVNNCKRLITIEEHSGECGLRETLSFHLMNKLSCAISIIALSAAGYPSGKYGDQKYHQAENNLVGKGLMEALENFLN